MAGLAFVSQELQQEILEEFTDVAVSASTAILGGPGFARNALERSVGAMRASDIIRRVAPAAAPPAAMRQILEMEAGELFNLLKSEQPQTIALVLSHLTAEKSSRVLALLSPEARQKVVERLAMMGPTPLEVVERIAGVLGKKTAQKPVRALSQTGGVKTAAQMLNSLDKSLSQSVLSDLEKHNPQLGEEIRRGMFTFEDLVLLGPAALQKLMREADRRDLAVALKTATSKLKNLLLSAVSKTAADALNREISLLGPLMRREIEAAQGRIVQAVRRLEGGGELNHKHLSNSCRNEFLV
jgi:flagellar motor switch protein FliG